MELALGTATLATFKNMRDRQGLEKFLKDVYSLGNMNIDTASLYSSLDAERLIGNYLPQDLFSNLSVSSKFGFYYSTLPFPFNRVMSRVRMKIDSTEQTRIGKASPINELDNSLIRLKRSSLETYFFHGVKRNIDYLVHLDIMKELKYFGKINNIGVSTNDMLSDLHPNIDVLQIPYSNLDYYTERTNCSLEVHSIVKSTDGSKSEIKKAIERISKFKDVSKIIIGTTNFNHYREIQEIMTH
jgi:aryl-alcohol dehydrogenase-like predicted oxidoreductase